MHRTKIAQCSSEEKAKAVVGYLNSRKSKNPFEAEGCYVVATHPRKNYPLYQHEYVTRIIQGIQLVIGE